MVDEPEKLIDWPVLDTLADEVITGLSGASMFGVGPFPAPPPPHPDITTRQAGSKASFKKFRTIFMVKLRAGLLLIFNFG